MRLPSFSFLRRQHEPSLVELKRQLAGVEGHWHHVSSRDELVHVLAALGASDVTVVEQEDCVWASFRR